MEPFKTKVSKGTGLSPDDPYMCLSAIDSTARNDMIVALVTSSNLVARRIAGDIRLGYEKAFISFNTCVDDDLNDTEWYLILLK